MEFSSDAHKVNNEGVRPVNEGGEQHDKGSAFNAQPGGLEYDTSFMTPGNQPLADVPIMHGYGRTLAAEDSHERPITAYVPAEAGEVSKAALPSLEPGESYYFKDGEWREGYDDEHFDPAEPGTAYVEADTLTVGRAAPNEEVVLFAASEGCRIITLYNSANQEGAMLHIDAADLYTDGGERMIDEAVGVVSSLADASAVARLYGDVAASDIAEDAADWNDRLLRHLHGKGITNVRVVTEGYGKQVRLSLADGHVQARDAAGIRIVDEV